MREILKYVSLIVMLSSVPSCTIKEDRMECPCKLEIDLSPCVGKWSSVSFDLWDIKPFITEEFDPDFSARRQYDIRRGYWTATAYAGIWDSEVRDGAVHISPGCQSDRLFVFSGRVDAMGDDALVTVTPHKQYACLTIDLSSYGRDGKPYGIELVGNVAGLNLRDLSPLEGEFDISLDHRYDGIYEVLVPRQKDTSLKLLFWRDGVLLDTADIGEYIVRAGYDWSAEDLEDVTVKISYQKADVVVRVLGWDVSDPAWECVL